MQTPQNIFSFIPLLIIGIVLLLLELQVLSNKILNNFLVTIMDYGLWNQL